MMRDRHFERIAVEHTRVAQTLTMVEENARLFEPEQVELLHKILNEYEQAIHLSDSGT